MSEDHRLVDEDSADERFKRTEVKGMFDGPVYGLIVRLAAPIFAGMLFQILYSITDTIWISRIDLADPSIVGGTGIIFPIIFFAVALGQGIIVGISSLVARSIGEKNHDVLNRAAESGLVLALGLSVIFIIGGYSLDDVFVRLLGATGDYAVHALEYFQYILPAAALMFVGGVFHGILQGEGLMKYVMKAMIIGTIGNIILDPIFIFVLGMGVRGAALATVIAQSFAVVYTISVFVRGLTLVPVSWNVRNAHGATIRKITIIGMPAALGQMIMSVSFLFLNRVVVDVDPLALTAFALCGRFDQVVLMPIFAIGAALITLIGQNAGRGLFDRVAEIWKKGLGLALGTVAVIATAMVIFAPRIYPIFSSVDDVVRYAVLQTRIMEFTFLFAVTGILGRSVFQAIGYPMPALVLTLLRLVIIAIPAVYLYVYVFEWQMYGVWGGLITGNVITAAVGLFWVFRTLRRLREGKLTVASTS